MKTPSAAFSRSNVPFRSRISPDLTWPLLTCTMTCLGLPVLSSRNVMTPSTPLSLPFLPVLLPLTAERLGAYQRKRPPLELVAVVVGKLAGGADVFRLADDPERDAGEHRCHAVFLQ